MPDTTQPPGPDSASGMRLRLELFVEAMDASIDFYTKVLGFEVLREHPGNSTPASGAGASRLGSAPSQSCLRRVGTSLGR